jgi:hypothetical protein
MLKELKQLSVFDRIVYLDTNHSYKIDGKPSAKVSVTGLVGSVKHPFETDKWAAIKAKEFDSTPEEVKLVWKKNNELSTFQGSTLHAYIDNYYSNKIIPYNKNVAESILGPVLHNKMRENLAKLVLQFNQFYNDTKEQILPIKREFVIGDIDGVRVCGMLDMLSYNPQKNVFEIYDFKTNKDFNYTTKFNKKYNEPLSHLDDCEFSAYSLQLSLYKYIIEKYTDIRIADLYVVWFSINNETYQLIPLNYLEDEVKVLLNTLT